MSIVPLVKLTLVGRVGDKHEVLQRLQQMGLAHLVETATDEARSAEAGEGVRSLREALAWLLGSPRLRHHYLPRKNPDLKKIVDLSLENKQHRREARDRVEVLKKRIKSLQSWGDFRIPDAQCLGGYGLWLYRVPLARWSLVESLDLAWVKLKQDLRFHYLVVISEERPTREQLPLAISWAGPLSLSDLLDELDAVEVELEELAAQRYKLSHWIPSLARSIASIEDDADLELAQYHCQDLDQLFLLEAWVPARDEPALQSLAEETQVAMLLRDPEPQEQPPTLLENPDAVAAGSDVVGFFQVPGYRTWDPSAMMFVSFSLFFAMILADAGYALLCGLLLFLFRRRFADSATGQRLLRLGISMVGAALLFGVMVGSYFGLTPSPGSLLGHLKVMDINDFHAMMQLSISVGVFHLVVAHSMVAWTHRHSLRVLGSLGWVAALLGSLATWMAYIGTLPVLFLDLVGPALIGGGLLLVFLFHSDQAVHGVGDLFKRGLSGLQALYGVSRAFGDVLSYMRLFALGLSSASLAVTFNNLARQVHENVEGGGLILAFLIILAGHGLNFVLAIMGGVIHGLRLNLLEFNNWAIEGEGYPFRPFRKRGD